jgi:hypothetical protein
MWTDEELQKHRKAVMNGERDYDEDDDPFLVLGKLMKDAGKTLWKKVSNKELKGKIAEECSPEAPKDASSPVEKPTSRPPVDGEPWMVLTVTEVPTEKDVHVLPDTADTTTSDVQEDDYDPKLGTQTIVEGHTKYSWIKGKEDELAERQAKVADTPPTIPKPSVQAI